MEALYLLVPLSVAVVFAAIWIFLRASDGGQFDDMVGPAMRILQDDDKVAVEAKPESGTDADPQADSLSGSESGSNSKSAMAPHRVSNTRSIRQ